MLFGVVLFIGCCDLVDWLDWCVWLLLCCVLCDGDLFVVVMVGDVDVVCCLIDLGFVVDVIDV